MVILRHENISNILTVLDLTIGKHTFKYVKVEHLKISFFSFLNVFGCTLKHGFFRCCKLTYIVDKFKSCLLTSLSIYEEYTHSFLARKLAEMTNCFLITLFF